MIDHDHIVAKLLNSCEYTHLLIDFHKSEIFVFILWSEETLHSGFDPLMKRR